MQGIKHLVECNCVLPQFRKLKNPIFHKIEVFSVVDDEDIFKEKFIVCDNCGVVHKVTEIGKTEIQTKHESITSVRTLAEISLSLDDGIANILKQNGAHVSTWEYVEYIIDNNISGLPVVVSRETINGKTNIKYLELKLDGKFKIANDIIDNEVFFEWQERFKTIKRKERANHL